MRVAALDLGTNTCLLLVAEVSDGKITQVLHDEVQIVRLGQGVNQTRQFHPEALVRAEICFRGFQNVLRTYKVERIQACATSAARDVSNKGALIELGAQYGIPIEIISGEREAELTFCGTVRDPLHEPIGIIDIGGGSTEFILGDKTGLVARRSVDIGAVRLTEMFVTAHPVMPSEIMKMTQYVQERLLGVRKLFASHQPISKLIAVAGTPTTLAALDLRAPFVAEKIDGYLLSLESVRDWTQRLAQMSVEERQALAGMEPKRADVLVAGSLILMLSCQCLDVTSVEVSVRGLRYGLAKFLGGRVST